ncbi:hypothetical protein [uncultured Porphyromonas sp.]|jgi:hypothetical protein|uniref:hypothetical protein n=1 Tax=uncultured Porphyromonas sp. TaxID=159274 RepID=UPI00260FAC9A|nr:hypothetical protein [uncultured Porphyromonas sp.]
MEENILLPFPSDYDEKLKVSSLDPNTEVMVVQSNPNLDLNYFDAREMIARLPRILPASETPEGVGEVRISNKSRDKLVNSIKMYDSILQASYLRVIPHITELVKQSVLLEEHRDRVKNSEGKRVALNESGLYVNKVQRLYGCFKDNLGIYRVKTTIQVFNENTSLGVHHGYDITKIELLSPIPGVMEESPAGNKVLNNSSIDELLNPKTGSPRRGEYQPLNSNSIEELISPKTSNLMHSEVDLPPLTSSISLAKLLKGVELSYEPNVKLLDAMQACHQFALTSDYTELVRVYETARNKRLSTTLSDPLQSVKEAQAEMVASTRQATQVVVPSSPVQEKAQAILAGRSERNDNTLNNAQEEQVERKSQSHKL